MTGEHGVDRTVREDQIEPPRGPAESAIRGRSEQRDHMLIEWDVDIPCDDGAVLRADMFRPLEQGSFPALVSMGGFGKNLPVLDGYRTLHERMLEAAPEIARDSTNQYLSFETPDPERWVSRGYAYVRVDARGAGRSPGHLENYSPREGLDLRDAVEWVADRPWCTGRIGTIGAGYYAVLQWMAAAHQPPHLRAICVWDGWADLYRDVARHGGILSQFKQHWFEGQIARVQHGRDSSKRDLVSGLTVTGDVDLSDEDLAANRGPHLYESFSSHPLDGGFYRDRSADWSRITVPILSSGTWGAAGIHLRGNVEGFTESASHEKWLVLREPGFHTLLNDEGVELQSRFFDWYLKDEGDWPRSQPRVSLKVRHPGAQYVARDAAAWPLPSTRWEQLYLDPEHQALRGSPVGEPSQATYSAAGEGTTMFAEPADGTREITGPLCAELWVSSSTSDADLFLTLRLFHPDGHELFAQGIIDPMIPWANGWLRLSHRELDEVRSLPWRPYHSHTRLLPVAPDEVVRVRVEIWPTSITVPPGHRLALTVQGTDYTHGGPGVRMSHDGTVLRGSQHWEHRDPQDRPPETFENDVTIYAGPGRPAHILLPVIATEEATQ
jgi:uncharacterized protein